MREIKELPIFTQTFASAEQFRPQPNSTYIHGTSPESRVSHVDSWRSSAKGIQFKEITSEADGFFSIAGESVPYSLRSEDDLARLIDRCAASEHIYLDITGLTHATWAGLLRKALLMKRTVFAVYVEPDSYSRSTAPIEGQIYDLSARIQGISPLPGFAVLSSRNSSDFTFIPLLGFEGTRLRYAIEQIQPGAEKIIPIIGSPGFKPWYVFETYIGNKPALSETDAWMAVRYAPANCPFSCFYLLQEIAHAAGTDALKIGLIGTKPHALGAVLFSLASEKAVELIHDHPIRRLGRTSGVARLLAYNVSVLFGNDSPLYNHSAAMRSHRRRGR